MQHRLSAGAALLLGAIMVLPSVDTFNAGGQALAAEGTSTRNGERSADGSKMRKTAPSAARRPPPQPSASQPRKSRVRTKPKRHKEYRRVERRRPYANLFCVSSRRIKRRLRRRGWDLRAFRRRGRRIYVEAVDDYRERHALILRACSGRIIDVRNIEREHNNRIIKKSFGKMTRKLKKLF